MIDLSSCHRVHQAHQGH